MERMVLADLDKCIGCRTCEIICSLKHEGRCNPAEARISVIKFEEKGFNIPMYCMQCSVPACEAICPTKAIYREEVSGALIIDLKKCIGCKMCILACPIGGLSLHPIKKIVIKCDLCSGEPACVNFCPEQALEFISIEKVSLKMKRKSMTRFSSYLEMLRGE
jgi:Fe-S-cluster-containing hydrogenase component 2